MNELKGIIEDCNKSDLISDKIIKKIISIIGQEKWQDLHDENNDICTTMGELIITLKGIVELEQENADLKEEIDEIAFARSELEQENESLENVKNIYIGILFKAKKIIRDFLSVAIDYIDKEDKNYSFIVEAEQFLKEE